MMSLWANTRVVSQVLSWVNKRVKSAFAPQRLIISPASTPQTCRGSKVLTDVLVGAV